MFVCPYCGRDDFAKRFGLRNHMNRCHKTPRGAKVDVDYEKAISTSNHIKHKDSRDLEDSEEFMRQKRAVDAVQSGESNATRYAPPKRKKGGIDLGAFLILDEHIPLFIDLDFAAALAQHILTTGSENKAIMAFAHKLHNAVGDFEREAPEYED